MNPLEALSPVLPPDHESHPDPTERSSRERPDRCAHCGLPLGRRWRADLGPFCCEGCRSVYALIHSEGLERFYDLKRCATAPPGERRHESFAWLEALLAETPAWPNSTTKTVRLDLQGVHCTACVWLIERLFERHPAGSALRINPALGTVELRWDPEVGELQDFLAEVEDFGYRFGPPHKRSAHRSQSLLIRLGICAAVAMNVMIFSLSYYAGLNVQDDPLVFRLFGRISLLLATLALVVGGGPFFASAFRGLRSRVAHVDLPIALGMGMTYAGSVWAYITQGADSAYFDTLTIFITLMLLGRWLQESVIERNRNLLLSSAGIADLFARRLTGGRIETVAVSEIREGDEVWIAPGDLIPTRGILLHRGGSLSMDWITGEAAPVEVAPGATVVAGAFNTSDHGLRVHVTEDFSASHLNDLIREETPSTEELGEARHWWHRVATIYVGAVLLLGGAALLLWASAGWHRAIEVCVSVLVISCPCAIGIGLPLAREMAHSRLRRRGVLLRRDSFLDRALQIRHIVFDKTGTLTRSQLRLRDDSRRALLDLDAPTRKILLSMCSRSKHPVSKCIAAALSLEVHRPQNVEQDVDAEVADAVREHRGRGLSLSVEGREFRIGRPTWVSPAAPSIDGATSAIGIDGELLLVVHLEEELRGDAVDEVRALRGMGLGIHLLSGDRTDKVKRVARQLGIEPQHAHAELSPEDKAEALTDIDQDDTLMVGDGLNDILGFEHSFAAATPAVDRTFLAQKSDFYFLGDGIAAVRRALLMSHRLRRVQTEILIFAALYNLTAIALCLAGRVSPVVAAILMPLSSVTIVLWTRRRLSGDG